MKKIGLILIASLAIFGGVYAQDIIIKKDGSRFEGKVLERTPEFIIFQNSVSGEKSVVSISEVDRVEANVSEEPPKNQDYYGTEVAEEKAPGEDFSTDYGKNIVSFNLLEFGILFNVNASYERIMSGGYLGIGVGYGTGLEYTSSGNLASTVYNYNTRYNLDINIYPAGQHRASYFIGPSILYGMYSQEDPTKIDEYIDKNYTSFLINNGVQISVSKNFGVSTKIGLGVIREVSDDGYKGLDLCSPLFSFAMSFRF